MLVEAKFYDISKDKSLASRLAAKCMDTFVLTGKEMAELFKRLADTHSSPETAKDKLEPFSEHMSSVSNYK